jgi:hypothetical protein
MSVDGVGGGGVGDEGTHPKKTNQEPNANIKESGFIRQACTDGSPTPSAVAHIAVAMPSERSAAGRPIPPMRWVKKTPGA